MALLSINKGKSGAANAALEALLRDDKGLSQIAVKSQKTKEVVMYAVETLLLFGYTAKACEACTLVQSTDNKYAGDYDSFFRILRGALPADCLETQVVVVCSAPEIPREGTWNDEALRRHTVHGNLRILMVSCFKQCCCFDALLLQEAQMMDSILWEGVVKVTRAPRSSQECRPVPTN